MRNMPQTRTQNGDTNTKPNLDSRSPFGDDKHEFGAGDEEFVAERRLEVVADPLADVRFAAIARSYIGIQGWRRSRQMTRNRS